MDYYDNVPEFSLTITGGGESGERFVFNQPEVTLGRVQDNDLVLYDPAVSRRHIVVYYRNNQFIIEDLGSSNGTLLNGYLLSHPTVLCEGDIIEVGAVRFQFSESIEETDDPTEIEAGELSPPVNDDPSKEPIVRRWDGSTEHPLPPEGDTRTFSPQRLQPQGAPPPAQAPIGYQQGAAPSQPAFPADHHQRATGQHPMHGSAAPMPSMPHPSQLGQQPGFPPRPQAPMPSMPPTPAQAPGQLPPFGGPGNMSAPAPKNKPTRGNKQERRHIQILTIWSFFLFVLAVGLMAAPIKPARIGDNTTRNTSTPISIDATKGRVFGYNKLNKERALQVKKVTFRFFYRNGRTVVIYQSISPNTPLQVRLNGKLIANTSTTTEWTYQRHRLPKKHLKKFQFNDIEFSHQEKATVNWGITHIKIKEKVLPPPNISAARKYCQEGEKYYHNRSQQPNRLHKALTHYLQCQDHLARFDKPQQPTPENLALYRQAQRIYQRAGDMISRIEQKMDLIFQQKLRPTFRIWKKPHKTAADIETLKRIYKNLLLYFPEPFYPQHQRISALTKKLTQR